MPREPATGYGLTSRALHWTVALLIVVLIPLGWYMVELDYYDPWANDSLELHKGLGMIVLALAPLMILWRHVGYRPPAIKTQKRWEVMAGSIAHYLLYALMLIVPPSGYIISTSAGAGVSVFGLFEVPAVLPRSDALRDAAITVHYYVAYVGAALIAFHVAGALKHHLIDKDDTLRRMLRG